MLRAFFLAMGISLCILGGECLILDKAVLAARNGPAVTDQSAQGPAGGFLLIREVVPPEWAAWSLLSVGVVVMIYSFTVPRRVAG